jgi:hypothetical protein
MSIEKLERYSLETNATTNACGCAMDAGSNGDYVLYSAARAREDALLFALKKARPHVKDCCGLSGPCDPESGVCACSIERDLHHIDEIIRQIESTR